MKTRLAYFYIEGTERPLVREYPSDNYWEEVKAEHAALITDLNLVHVYGNVNQSGDERYRGYYK